MLFLSSLQNPHRYLIRWVKAWPLRGIQVGEEGREQGLA